MNADTLANETEIKQLVDQLEDAHSDQVAAIGSVLERHPDDPRLHFMLGSVFADKAEYIKAHAALSRALELAPDYTLARYQLGFFELTSGETDNALSTWGPILKAPKDNYLRVFVEGMVLVIGDNFSEAIAMLEKGIALNQENPAINRDIELLVRELNDSIEKTGKRSSHRNQDESATTSATSLLLGKLGSDRAGS